MKLINKGGDLWVHKFTAMASDCEVWLEAIDIKLIKKLASHVEQETLRIQNKFSRFTPSSVIYQINEQPNKWHILEQETRALIKFADQAWQISNGLIDISILPLQKLWKFDAKSQVPRHKDIIKTLQWVNWQNISFKNGKIKLLTNMQIDLGAIGKEYAVDKAGYYLANKLKEGGIMLNFGGDVLVVRELSDSRLFSVALETNEKNKYKTLKVKQGAIATSGNTKKFILDKEGNRLGHIINPKTGYPPIGAPSLVSVIDTSCMQAGLFATLAILQGAQASNWLDENQIQAFCHFDK